MVVLHCEPGAPSSHRLHVIHQEASMKTLAILTVAAATLFGVAAHANDVDHWAGDDGKNAVYAPAYGGVNSFNRYNGAYQDQVILQQQPAGTGVAVHRHHRRAQ